MRATNLSWSASALPAGNGVAIVGAAASAAVSTPPALIERAATRVYSLSNRWVRGAVTNDCSALEHAAEPNSGVVMPLKATGPAVETWYWTAVLPGQEDRVARHVDAGEGRVAVAGDEEVAHAAAPARRRAFRRRRLPDRLLVVVREELRRQRHRRRGVLRLGRRLDQRADVEHHAELAGDEVGQAAARARAQARTGGRRAARRSAQASSAPALRRCRPASAASPHRRL